MTWQKKNQIVCKNICQRQMKFKILFWFSLNVWKKIKCYGCKRLMGSSIMTSCIAEPLPYCHSLQYCRPQIRYPFPQALKVIYGRPLNTYELVNIWIMLDSYFILMTSHTVLSKYLTSAPIALASFMDGPKYLLWVMNRPWYCLFLSPL